jgi:hypothetical protein
VNEIVGAPDRRDDQCVECGRWDGHYVGCETGAESLKRTIMVRSTDGEVHLLPIEER